jgi:hypothetical protein
MEINLAWSLLPFCLIGFIIHHVWLHGGNSYAKGDET